jgi:hypothetical protein
MNARKFYAAEFRTGNGNSTVAYILAADEADARAKAVERYGGIGCTPDNLTIKDAYRYD